jgi:hypothetical protein
MLELEFLKKVDWKIVPEPSILEAYYTSMVSQDARYIQSGPGLDSSHGVPGVQGLQTVQGQTMHGSPDMQGIHNSDDTRYHANRNRTLSNDENFDDRDPKSSRTDTEMDIEMDAMEP